MLFELKTQRMVQPADCGQNMNILVSMTGGTCPRTYSSTLQLSPGVIYVGHIPRGLFEPQLKSYF